MLVALLVFILIFSAITLAKTLPGKDYLLLKLSLVGVYSAIVGLLINTYQAGITSDQNGLSGSTVGWFGDWWLLWLIGFIIAAVIGQVFLYSRRKHKTGHNN